MSEEDKQWMGFLHSNERVTYVYVLLPIQNGRKIASRPNSFLMPGPMKLDFLGAKSANRQKNSLHSKHPSKRAKKVKKGKSFPIDLD